MLLPIVLHWFPFNQSVAGAPSLMHYLQLWQTVTTDTETIRRRRPLFLFHQQTLNLYVLTTPVHADLWSSASRGQWVDFTKQKEPEKQSHDICFNLSGLLHNLRLYAENLHFNLSPTARFSLDLLPPAHSTKAQEKETTGSVSTAFSFCSWYPWGSCRAAAADSHWHGATGAIQDKGGAVLVAEEDNNSTSVQI